MPSQSLVYSATRLLLNYSPTTGAKLNTPILIDSASLTPANQPSPTELAGGKARSGTYLARRKERCFFNSDFHSTITKTISSRPVPSANNGLKFEGKERRWFRTLHFKSRSKRLSFHFGWHFNRTAVDSERDKRQPKLEEDIDPTPEYRRHPSGYQSEGEETFVERLR